MKLYSKSIFYEVLILIEIIYFYFVLDYILTTLTLYSIILD